MSQQQQNPQKQAKSKEQLEKEKANTNAWQKKQQEKKKKKLQQQQQQQKPVELDQKALQKAKRKQQKRLQRQQMLKEQQLAKQGSSTPASQTTKETKEEQKKNQQEKKPQAKTQSKKEQKKVEEKPQSNKQIEKAAKKQAKKGAQSSAKQQQSTVPQPTRKLSKDTVAVTSSAPIVPKTPIVPKIVYTELLTLQRHIAKSFPKASPINKSAQSRLIHKYLDQYINQNDTVLILARSDQWQPLKERCVKRVYLYPNHNEFEKNPQCENITCTYEDIGYLMQGSITKIFVELDMVFANGAGLTQKGNQNIIVMGNAYKIPVIGYSGTWNFNAWNYLSMNTFLNKYGQETILRQDIIENELLQVIVLEIGSVIPKQISGHLENLSKIYRGCDFGLIKW